MIVGPPAVDRLLAQHPEAHRAFGAFPSTAAFGLLLDQPQFMTAEDTGCWLTFEDMGDRTAELHWFCPSGARIDAVRRILDFGFDAMDLHLIYGSQPPGHPQSREARVLARALGAARSGTMLLLTRQRFRDYNTGKFSA